MKEKGYNECISTDDSLLRKDAAHVRDAGKRLFSGVAKQHLSSSRRGTILPLSERRTTGQLESWSYSHMHQTDPKVRQQTAVALGNMPISTIPAERRFYLSSTTGNAHHNTPRQLQIRSRLWHDVSDQSQIVGIMGTLWGEAMLDINRVFYMTSSACLRSHRPDGRRCPIVAGRRSSLASIPT